VSKSALEAAFLQAWRIYASDYPQPETEFHFTRMEVGDNPHPPARPGLRQRLAEAGLPDSSFDFAFPDYLLAVEIDGGQFAPGGGRHNTDGDRHKLNLAARFNWRVLRFSGSMLKDPEACVEMVKASLN
jgi:hypothetical protein